MRMFTARVVGGRLDVPDGDLPEGATVTVLLPDEDGESFALTDEQRASLARSLDQADRGETVDGWELLRELDQ